MDQCDPIFLPSSCLPWEDDSPVELAFRPTRPSCCFPWGQGQCLDGLDVKGGPTGHPGWYRLGLLRLHRGPTEATGPGAVGQRETEATLFCDASRGWLLVVFHFINMVDTE